MAAEIAGVCVLTGVHDLVFYKNLCILNINQRINQILHTSLFMLLTI